MNEIEAKRIAAVISIIRPEWREGHVMAALGDERMRYRTYEDALVAAVACYSDMTTGKPGRIHEAGRWWLTVTATAPTPQIRRISHDDCGICHRPFSLHSVLSKVDDHEFEPQNVRGQGERPSDETRERIKQAAREAELTRTRATDPETAATEPEQEAS